MTHLYGLKNLIPSLIDILRFHFFFAKNYSTTSSFVFELGLRQGFTGRIQIRDFTV